MRIDSSAVAIVSFAERPNLRSDDRFLREAMESRGLRPVPVIWDDDTINWSAFDACVIRSVSDYHLKYDAFRRWLRMVGDLVPTWNPPKLVAWNADKTHLRTLGEHGVPTIPTSWLDRGADVLLADVLAAQGWEDAIIKPTVGLAAQKLHRVHTGENDNQAALETLLKEHGVMVQPFLSSVEKRGETSLIYIAGELTHAVRKRPAIGDFRVQGVWGGTSHLCDPSREELDIAEHVLSLLHISPLFARIDLVEGPMEAPCLIELEMIEPDLFFREKPIAADRLAAEISTIMHR